MNAEMNANPSRKWYVYTVKRVGVAPAVDALEYVYQWVVGRWDLCDAHPASLSMR